MPAKDHTAERLSAAMIGPAMTALAAVVLAAAAGCTSPLTTVALREFLREATSSLTPDPDAEEKLAADSAHPVGEEDPREVHPGDADPTDDDTLADDESDGATKADYGEEVPTEIAIERSLERLARTGGLDAVARDVLVETLEKSDTEDWPAIIDSFAASLETSAHRAAEGGSAPFPDGGSAAATTAAVEPQKSSERRERKPAGGLTIPVTATLPAGHDAPSAERAVYQETSQPPDPSPGASTALHGDAADASPAPEDAPESAGDAPAETPEQLVASLKKQLAEARQKAPLCVRRACFASKVRGWGSIDAFDEPRFVPGQSLLVYVELDNLVGVETPQGYATRVGANLQLVDASDRVVEEWNFPVVEDTADSQRTDYFVRYLVRIPTGAIAGPHRLRTVVNDTVSAKTVATELPLEVALDDGDRGR